MSMKHGGCAFQTPKPLPSLFLTEFSLLHVAISYWFPFQTSPALYIFCGNCEEVHTLTPQHDNGMMQAFKFATMPPGAADHSPDSALTDMSLKDTELTLGLPGEAQAVFGGAKSTCFKRGFSDAADLRLRSCSADAERVDWQGNEISAPGKAPALKAQVVGWPPVRSVRKKALKRCKYVKVAVDGAPYLRKVDLEMYSSYQQLLMALETMFDCFTFSGNDLDESKIMNTANGAEYMPTYEDSDGDWMLVGDVPWNMFVESCKRVRLMKSSEAVGSAPRTPSCTSAT